MLPVETISASIALYRPRSSGGARSLSSEDMLAESGTSPIPITAAAAIAAATARTEAPAEASRISQHTVNDRHPATISAPRAAIAPGPPRQRRRGDDERVGVEDDRDLRRGQPTRA